MKKLFLLLFCLVTLFVASSTDAQSQLAKPDETIVAFEVSRISGHLQQEVGLGFGIAKGQFYGLSVGLQSKQGSSDYNPSFAIEVTILRQKPRTGVLSLTGLLGIVSTDQSTNSYSYWSRRSKTEAQVFFGGAISRYQTIGRHFHIAPSVALFYVTGDGDHRGVSFTLPLVIGSSSRIRLHLAGGVGAIGTNSSFLMSVGFSINTGKLK